MMLADAAAKVISSSGMTWCAEWYISVVPAAHGEMYTLASQSITHQQHSTAEHNTDSRYFASQYDQPYTLTTTEQFDHTTHHHYTISSPHQLAFESTMPFSCRKQPIELNPLSIPERTKRWLKKMNEQDEKIRSKLHIEDAPRHKGYESIVHYYSAGTSVY